MSSSRRAPTAREDFIATYFAHDDQVTKGMVNDYLDRIEAESRLAMIAEMRGWVSESTLDVFERHEQASTES